MSYIEIAIVDDQMLFRQGLIAMLKSQDDIKISIEAENGIDFIKKLESNIHLPNVALIDIEMPEMDGIELQEILLERYPSLKIITLSIHNNDRLMRRMIQHGASGYLLKNCDKTELLTAIRSTFEKGFYMNEKMFEALRKQGSSKENELRDFHGNKLQLTKREIEVLKFLCRQYTTNEISEKLFISPRTVEGHRNNLLMKTGAKNIAGLVVFAIKHEFVAVY